MNLRDFNPRKITILDGFWYKTIFLPLIPVTAYGHSDLQFYVESYDVYHDTVAHCTKKPRKSREIHEFSEIFEKYSIFFRT